MLQILVISSIYCIEVGLCVGVSSHLVCSGKYPQKYFAHGHQIIHCYGRKYFFLYCLCNEFFPTWEKPTKTIVFHLLGRLKYRSLCIIPFLPEIVINIKNEFEKC